MRVIAGPERVLWAQVLRGGRVLTPFSASPLFNRSLYRNLRAHEDRGVRVDLFDGNGSGHELVVYRITEKIGEEQALCKFHSDPRNGLLYYFPQDGKNARHYLIDFDRDHGKSEGVKLNGITFYKGRKDVDRVVAVFEDDKFIELKDIFGSSPEKREITDREGNLAGVIAGAGENAPFAFPIDGFILQPIHRVITKVDGDKKYAYFCFPARPRGDKDVPAKFGTYFLHDEDINALGATQEGGVIVELEKGRPKAVYSPNDKKFEKPVYFRVVRDGSKFIDGHFEIVGSGRERLSRVDFNGIKVVEGIQTVSYDYPAEGRKREFYSLNGKTYQVATYPIDADFKPRHLSVVVVDSKKMIFAVPEPSLDEVSARIGNLVINIYQAGKYTRSVRTLAYKAFMAHKRGEEEKFDRIIRKLLRLYGIPVGKGAQNALYMFDYNGFVHYKLSAGRKRDGEYAYFSFMAKDRVFSVSSRDLLELQSLPQDGIAVQLEDGNPIAIFSPNDANHQKPVYFRVVRDYEKRNGENWDIVCSSRNVADEDLKGIKIVEGIKTFKQEEAGIKMRESFHLGDKLHSFAIYLPGHNFQPRHISVVVAENKDILFAVSSATLGSEAGEIVRLVVEIYKSGKFNKAFRKIAESAYQDQKDGKVEECRRKCEILANYSKIENVREDVQKEEKLPKPAEPVESPKPAITPKQPKQSNKSKTIRNPMPAYGASVKVAETLFARLEDGRITPEKQDSTLGSVLAYLSLPDDIHWELLKTEKGRKLLLRAAIIKKRIK